ncbi:MAG: hypothetical protein D6704_02315 [Nitrospirae bacterium]|nr:MAG: hypothetical protein D6704_02315 [Nitrospirota bacterium]
MRERKRGFERDIEMMLPNVTEFSLAQTQNAQAEARIAALKEKINHTDLKEASEAFEAYFIAYLLKVMRNTVPKGSLTQNRMGEAFRVFYDEEIGKQAARAGGIGLARYIEASLRELQSIPTEMNAAE